MTDASRRRWPIVVAVQLAVLLAALEATVVGTATPTLIAALGGARLYPWVFAAYMLASTVVMPVFGSLADRLGRKGPFLGAIGLFCAGSVVAGAARSMPVLIGGRLIQGLGAGGLISLSLIIFGDLYAGPRRGQMQGLITVVWGLASLGGPVLGGVIVDRWSWRWVFLMNPPLGVLVAGLVLWGLHAPVERGRAKRLDVKGAGAFVLGATALLFTCLAPGAGPGGRAISRAVAAGVAVVGLGAFARIERVAPDPLLPPDLFGAPVFLVSAASGFFTGAAMFGALVHVPMLVQWGQGTSATTAGLPLMSMSTGWSVGAFLAGQLVNRTGFRSLAVAGSTVLAAGYVALALSTSASWRGLVGIGAVMGIGMGFVSLTGIVAVQTLVRREQRGVATAGVLFFRNVGATLGVALMGAILTTRLGVGLGELGAPGEGVPSALAATLAGEMAVIFWLGVGAMLVALVTNCFLPDGSPLAEAQRPAERVPGG